ncbi:DUF2786 domain-containing protein [Amycolatopsis vancoresmycina]|uniref:DUF2786 domain-containing protein n=1 Tax=Amycolatopsis vancoresmycina DSM 44592 TaxID=1292037 RepID=R1GCF8_9PSEU|nr:DUF2786 domain-containing protein [Amycolatopsis vancoresmycina]EOD68968.1 hypothetical protein H480_08638 [Amycolatopsis vancoresmycina DSM 44592]
MGKRKPPARELPTTAEGFAAALLATARAGDDPRWLAPGFELPTELAGGAQLAVRPLLDRARRGGWPPEDLRQAANRRLGEFACSYLLDDGPHLAEWAAKHILTPAEAVTAVVDALGLLLTLPVLAAAPQPAVRHGVDDRKLGRVRALLAKAESSSFPEEAEALSAKAQELMTRHALDRVLVTAGPELPASRRIWLDTPYTDAKSLLVHVVAKANRCRAVFDPRWDFVTVVGDDLDAVALLTTSLLVQATRAMVADPAGRSRPFRKSFLVSYATRIGERLEQAAAATLTATPDADRLRPALASHDLRVNTAFTALFPQVAGKSVTVRSAEGWHAGRSAADRARLGE